MKRNINISTSTLVKVVVILMGLLVAWEIRNILLLVFVSFVLASALMPTVDWLHARRISRVVSISGIYILGFGILVGIVSLLIPMFGNQWDDLQRELPRYQKLVDDTLGRTVSDVSLRTNQGVYSPGEIVGIELSNRSDKELSYALDCGDTYLHLEKQDDEVWQVLSTFDYTCTLGDFWETVDSGGEVTFNWRQDKNSLAVVDSTNQTQISAGTYRFTADYCHEFENGVCTTPERVHSNAFTINGISTQSGEGNVLADIWQSFREQSSSGGIQASSVIGVISSFLGGVIGLLTVLVLVFYMVLEESAIKRAIAFLTPDEYTPYVTRLVRRVQDRLGAWLSGQLILSAVVGTFVYIGLEIIGVEYALFLGLVAAVFEIVPWLGPWLGAVPGVFIAFTISPIAGVMAIVLYLLVQQLENQIIAPQVMKRVVGLNPIIIIVSLLIGVQLAGFLGVFIALPTAIIIATFAHDFMGNKRTVLDEEKVESGFKDKMKGVFKRGEK